MAATKVSDHSKFNGSYDPMRARQPPTLFGIQVQPLKDLTDKQAILSTLEANGCPWGTRIHALLTDAHQTVLSRYKFFVAGRRRTPSWWLVLTRLPNTRSNAGADVGPVAESHDAFVAVLVEQNKKPDFPHPRMHLWPGRWNPELYGTGVRGDNSATIFVVQPPDLNDATGTGTIVVEDVVTYPSSLFPGMPNVRWSDTTFSTRWRVVQTLLHEHHAHDDAINPIRFVLRDYHSLSSLPDIADHNAVIEFVPEDAGRKRLFLTVAPSAFVESSEHRTVPAKASTVHQSIGFTPKTLATTYGTRSVLAPTRPGVRSALPGPAAYAPTVLRVAHPVVNACASTVTATNVVPAPVSTAQGSVSGRPNVLLGLIRDAQPDVYKTCTRSPEGGYSVQGMAAVRTLMGSRALKTVFDSSRSHTPLVWKCRWVESLSKWEPFEYVGSWMDHSAHVSLMTEA